MCRELKVVSDTLATYSLWIVVNGDGGKQETFAVTIKVLCGLEHITLSQPLYLAVLDLDVSVAPPPYSLLFSSVIRALFTTDLP